MSFLRLSGVEKTFGATRVLRGIDLEVPAGAFAVLVGPSGCGKSTLLRLLAGLEQVSGGTIALDGRDVTALEPRERDIAMVFQSYALYPHMTVRQNLEFGLKMRGELASGRARVDEAAAMLGLGDLLDRLPRELSGGQRQRVAMGRAIVRRPKLFLFDEPLSNLDPALRSQVRVDIRSQHDRLQATSVYVTHDQVEAMTLADVLFVLDGGEVQQSGAPLAVYERPRNLFVAKFLGSPAMNILDGVVARDGVRLARSEAVVRVEDDVALPPDGAAVKLGVRAHDFVLDENGPWSFTPEIFETLGPEVHLHGEVEGERAVVAVSAARAPRRGQRVRLAPSRVHVFDPSTQESLWRG